MIQTLSYFFQDIKNEEDEEEETREKRSKGEIGWGICPAGQGGGGIEG